MFVKWGVIMVYLEYMFTFKFFDVCTSYVFPLVYNTCGFFHSQVLWVKTAVNSVIQSIGTCFNWVWLYLLFIEGAWHFTSVGSWKLLFAPFPFPTMCFKCVNTMLLTNKVPIPNTLAHTNQYVSYGIWACRFSYSVIVLVFYSEVSLAWKLF